MKNIFRRLFRRKNSFAIDCETCGPDGSRVAFIRDASGIIREVGTDYNRLTEVLHSMPVKATNLGETNPAIIRQRQELWEWNMVARQLHTNIGYRIEQLDELIAQNLREIVGASGLNDTDPLLLDMSKKVNAASAKEIEELIK